MPPKDFSIFNLVDFIPTVSVVPTWVPRRFFEQFAIYVNGATLRFYAYDTKNHAWHYITFTA